MQTLRKKTSPLKYKNETTRFLGDGVSFKAKLIGILEVSEARGDRMCQEALSDLKMAIRAAGEHKQRITINIAIDGLRLRDEKTGDSLYHHPVHKISFIAQDMTDSRAFGYIFGSPDTGHRFFGIKTDKAASQVVIAMRDLFQVVFALKKKEIELAKQQLDKTRFVSSPMFSESSISSTKPIPQEPPKTIHQETKASAAEAKSGGTAVADLVDLELELNSLQQGLNQMERITPSDPFGSKDDPFGDSFTSYTKPILPPPPSSGRERSSRASDSGSVFSPRTPHTLNPDSAEMMRNKSDFSFSHDFGSSREEASSGDWFTPSGGNSIFEEPHLVPEMSKDEKHEMAKQEILSQFDVFTELDPLELKNPPKKVLNDLVSQSQPAEPLFTKPIPKSEFASDPFGEDPFVKEDPFAETDFPKSDDPFEAEFRDYDKPDTKGRSDFQSLYSAKLAVSPKSSLFTERNFSMLSTSPKTVQFGRFDGKLLHLHENPSLDMSSESECAPEPPPRPLCTLIQPPPLPPKKIAEVIIQPPPRPPHADDSHYDYMDHYETAPNSLEYIGSAEKSPPLPAPVRKSKFESDFVPERPKKFNPQSSEEDYLTPIPPKNLIAPPPKKHPEAINDHLNCSLEGLDISLSQLTLSGLNELATKLNIPPTQLSNMTLAQLTSYLSNFIRSTDKPKNTNSEFKPDFAANFTSTPETYDRYAVFRELMNEEIKQTKIDTEPEELLEQQEEEEEEDDEEEEVVEIERVSEPMAENGTPDRYAALREIVACELKLGEPDLKEDKNESELSTVEEENILYEEGDEDTEGSSIVNLENKLNVEEQEKLISPTFNLIEYNANLDTKDKVEGVKSPIKGILSKSPVPIAVTEIIQNNARLTSGSLSDAISGSSPEVDNTASNSEVGKKADDAAGESWSIFEQSRIPSEVVKEKQPVQSEEGVSPWSSDSKEYGNGSPTDYRGADHWAKRRGRREQEGHRRSTDSYEEEYYECYERPPRRRKQPGYVHGGQAAGGHSSSSRDVSPWEEEPRRREPRPPGWGRHPRQQSFDKHRERRHTDSWDDEEDYEYEDEHLGRFHRHDRERHSAPDRWVEDWSEDRRHRRRRDGSERWCCPDREPSEHEKPRYGVGRRPPEAPPGPRRKHDDRYYSRESQESPWEDEYANEEETPQSQYLTAKRNWKRPSSASEMDRKTGEIKSRHYLAPGGSDGERERRYKPGRRSRSRDSQYTEPAHRHKPEAGAPARMPHRTKPYPKSQFEGEFSEGPPKKVDSKADYSNKKSATSAVRKKGKELKSDENIVSTFPRKGRGKSVFENEFVSSEESPVNARLGARFHYENDIETSEAESPTVVNKVLKGLRQQSLFESDKHRRALKESRLQPKAKSLFEDDFSPSDKPEALPEDNSISSIKEENDAMEEEDSFSTNHFENATNSRRKKFNKHRLSSSMQADINIKKSESVNIFGRESDPFDDDFFCESATEQGIDYNEPRTTDLKWTDDFQHFDVNQRK